MRYTFGSSDTAAGRLADLASFWNPLSECWVRSAVSVPPRVALDLGCGPGFSTAMLHEAARAIRTIGVDNAPTFLEEARRRHPSCSFIEHDVTRLPLPMSADLIYGRFLLAHLPDPERLFHAWSDQGGMLLVEEPEAIETSVPVFRRYLDLAAGMIASQGGDLYVGRRLADTPVAVRGQRSEGAIVSVPNARAAGWFRRNVESVWASDPYIVAHCPSELRRSIHTELSALCSGDPHATDITWTIRRIALGAPR